MADNFLRLGFNSKVTPYNIKFFEDTSKLQNCNEFSFMATSLQFADNNLAASSTLCKYLTNVDTDVFVDCVIFENLNKKRDI